MIHRILFTFILHLAIGNGYASEVELAALGSLQLEFETAEAVELFPAQPLAARVSYRKGDAFNLISPGRLQQIDYLVEPGSELMEGEAFAILRGPEMHHFRIEYEASKKMLEAASRRFDNNKSLYERKAIRESQWIEVSENFYAAQLEYEHLRHFYELVDDKGDEEPHALTLVAPFSGLVNYRSGQGMVERGESIAELIPQQAIRLEVAIPNEIHRQAAYLETDNCRLAIERVAGVTRGFFVNAWTEALKPECQLIPGQALLVTPLLRSAVYRLPKSAVFQWHRGSAVLLNGGQSLSAVPVDLLATEGRYYILRSAEPLAGREVLVSSVSAVQGLLMGLGGE